MELGISKAAGSTWKFEAATTITVGPLSVDVELVKDGGAYSLAVSVESFKLSMLGDMIGQNPLSDYLGLLGSLSDFGIKDFKLVKEFGESSSLR